MVVLSTTVSMEIDATQIEAFEHIVPIDLPSIFTGYGPLPAVTDVQTPVAYWHTAGQKRTVYLSDGSSMQETLNECLHPDYFSYTVSGFSNVLGLLTTSAQGAWWFKSQSQDNTHVRWQYAFTSRTIMAVPLLWCITQLLWGGYMNNALSLAKQQLETRVS